MKDDKIRVTVIYRSDRGRFLLRHIDPYTGKAQFRATDAKTRRQAEKAAGAWESELRDGRYAPRSRTTWPIFRERYQDEHLASLAKETFRKVVTVLDLVEEVVSPQYMRDLTAERMSMFQHKLRERGLSEPTIASYSAHVRAALRWAARMGLMREAPRIDRPKRAKNQKLMKGRPVTGEEFERMLKATRSVVGKKAAKSVRRFLVGLWWGGLRLGEALELYWDRDDRLCIDTTGRSLMLRIPAAMEKGNQDRLLAIAPEFARLLQRVPPERRRGRVFAIDRKDCRGQVTGFESVSNLITAIGRKAGVKVDTRSKLVRLEDGSTNRVEAVKYASAHDLRRAFGERWAARVEAATLMEIMRHESIETTLRYYVGRNGQRTAEIMRQAYERAIGNQFGNQRQESRTADVQENDANPSVSTGRGGT